MQRQHRKHDRGFTIPELLIVISIMVIVVAITFPAMQMMARSVGDGTGVNTVSTAVSAIRAFATRDIKDEELFNGAGQTIGMARYSGVALLFTPSNEVRLLENHQRARRASDGSYLEIDPANPLNGYRDIPNRDYFSVPEDTGIVGVARGTNGLYLFTPPFALRFNEHGHHIAGITGDRLVFYDGNYDGWYDTNDERPNNYDPSPYDPVSRTFDPGTFDQDEQRYTVPFEEIETVIAVLVYSKEQFLQSGLTLEGSGPRNSLNNAAENWILQRDPDGEFVNAEPLFFSRYTGSVLRKDTQ